MQDVGLSLIVGIASSLVATGIFISLSELTRRVLLQWYADKIYRGVRVDGEWEVDKVAGKEVDLTASPKLEFMRLNLKQRGEVIEGSYVHKAKGDGEEVEEYALNGKIRNMYFLATATPKSDRRIDGISFLLHISYTKSKLVMAGAVLSQNSPGAVSCHQGIEFTLKDS